MSPTNLNVMEYSILKPKGKFLIESTKTRPVIGFTRDYYTLWYEKEIRWFNTNNKDQFYLEYKYDYKQNLSKDFERAVEKAKEKGLDDFKVDTYLRGEFSSFKYITYAEDRMQFGVYANEPVEDVYKNDLSYFLWYVNAKCHKDVNPTNRSEEKHRDFLFSFLDGLDTVKKYKDKFRHIDTIKKIKSDQRRKNRTEYLGNIGDRLTETVVLKMRTSFESRFGRCYVHKFVKGNHTIVYMGNRLDVDLDEKINLTFTVKNHSEYNGEKQTKVSRPKIVK